MTALLHEEKVEDTIAKMNVTEFAVLDFIGIFEMLQPENRRRLNERFGQLGEKRKFTVSAYLSNRPERFSQKTASLVQSFSSYAEQS